MSLLLNYAPFYHICGVDELERAPIAEATRIVSIIPPENTSPLEGIDKPLLILRFDDIIEPEPGLTLPTEEHIRELLAFDAAASSEDRLLVHCTAGISRSTAALAILLAKRHPGHEDEIFETLRHVRAIAWPNSLMVAIGDQVLGRGGSLTSALRRHYSVQAGIQPELGKQMIAAGRRSEVPTEDYPHLYADI